MCHWWLMGGSPVTKWPITSLDELHPSLTLSVYRFCFSPIRGLLSFFFFFLFFFADPGVRWKTYTHKHHLLFMPYSPVIHSQHAPATTAVQPLRALTDGKARPNGSAFFKFIRVKIWLLKPTAFIAVSYWHKHICVASGFTIRRSFTHLTASRFLVKLTMIASCKYTVCIVAVF